MAVASHQCPNCHQLVPNAVHICPHCNVYLHLPDYPGFATRAQADQAATQARSEAPTGVVRVEALPDALKQCDATATTGMLIAGALIAIDAGAIFAGKVLARPLFAAVIYTLPLFLLLVTLILYARVLDPAGSLSIDALALFKCKNTRLRYSLLALEISIALLAISVFFYLIRPATTP